MIEKVIEKDRFAGREENREKQIEINRGEQCKKKKKRVKYRKRRKNAVGTEVNAIQKMEKETLKQTLGEKERKKIKRIYENEK